MQSAKRRTRKGGGGRPSNTPGFLETRCLGEELESLSRHPELDRGRFQARPPPLQEQQRSGIAGGEKERALLT